jgi:hypothetical protein
MTAKTAKGQATQKQQRTATVSVGDKTRKVTAFEGEFDEFVDLLSFEYDGNKVGAILLKSGESKLQVRFCFLCKGIPPLLREELIDPSFDRFVAGTQDLPKGETLTIRHTSFVNDLQRQTELTRVIENSSSSTAKLFLLSEQHRLQQLTATGTRKERKLEFWCTFTYDPDEGKETDALEKATKGIFQLFQKGTGEYVVNKKATLLAFLERSYREGFLRWQQLLTNKMGLTVETYTVEDVWASNWARLNQTIAPPAPHYFLCRSKQEPKSIERAEGAPMSVLLESSSSVPVADARWLYSNKKYVGILSLKRKPAGWEDKNAQLRYLWKLISAERVYDTEIFCQISLANSQALTEQLMAVTKESTVSTKMSAQKGDINVMAGLNEQKAVDAQVSIMQGDAVIKLAMVVLVHRPSLQELDDACSEASSMFTAPMALVRESYYAWKTWCQTFPMSWNQLMRTPFERRTNVLTGELPGLLALVRTPPLDKSGLEYIAAEGGAPVYIDIYDQHRNLAIFGATRSGKSVDIAKLLTHACARGIPVTAIDYPKADGSGTFRDWTWAMKGAYLDISTEAINPFEIPDLKAFENDIVEERMKDFTDSLAEILMVMVMGSKLMPGETLNPVSVRAMLNKMLQVFFSNPDIGQRYSEANYYGFGSEAWQNYPTLRHFIKFCAIEQVGLFSPTDADRYTIGEMKNRLEGKLSTTNRLSSTLSHPSTFRSDNNLVVLALRNLSSDEDACLMMMVINNLILARSLSFNKSIVFIDEAPILFNFDSIAEQIARLCANGAKAGIRVVISAQGPGSIVKSPSADKIFDNISCRLVGKIEPMAVKALVDLQIPRNLVLQCAEDAFAVNKSEMYSNWLIDIGGTYVNVRSYSPPILLAAVANNKEEQDRRDYHMKVCNGDRIKGLIAYSKEKSGAAT